MNNKKGQAGSVIFFVFLIVGIILFFVFFVDGIDKVLNKECEKEGMKYVYHKGSNCIDKDDVLHPFVYEDCEIFVWSNDCKIRFVKVNEG